MRLPRRAVKDLFPGWFGHYDMSTPFEGVIFSDDGKKHTSKGSEGYLRFDYGPDLIGSTPDMCKLHRQQSL